MIRDFTGHHGIPLDEIAQHQKEAAELPDCESCGELMTTEDVANDRRYCLECWKVYARQDPDPQEVD